MSFYYLKELTVIVLFFSLDLHIRAGHGRSKVRVHEPMGLTDITKVQEQREGVNKGNLYIHIIPDPVLGMRLVIHSQYGRHWTTRSTSGTRTDVVVSCSLT